MRRWRWGDSEVGLGFLALDPKLCEAGLGMYESDAGSNPRQPGVAHQVGLCRKASGSRSARVHGAV